MLMVVVGGGCWGAWEGGRVSRMWCLNHRLTRTHNKTNSPDLVWGAACGVAGAGRLEEGGVGTGRAENNHSVLQYTHNHRHTSLSHVSRASPHTHALTTAAVPRRAPVGWRVVLLPVVIAEQQFRHAVVGRGASLGGHDGCVCSGHAR